MCRWWCQDSKTPSHPFASLTLQPKDESLLQPGSRTDEPGSIAFSIMGVDRHALLSHSLWILASYYSLGEGSDCGAFLIDFGQFFSNLLMQRSRYFLPNFSTARITLRSNISRAKKHSDSFTFSGLGPCFLSPLLPLKQRSKSK